MIVASELPAAWGGMQLESDGRLTTVKSASTLAGVRTFPRNLIAAFLRAASKVAPEAQIEEARRVGEQAGIQEGREIERKACEALQKRADTLEATLREFELAAGVSIGEPWGKDPKLVGRVVKEVLAGGHSKALIRLHGMAGELERLVGTIRETIQR